MKTTVAPPPAPPAPGGLPRLLAEPVGFALLLLLFVLLHLALRLGLTANVEIDDSREALLGQSLEWGYLARQPPLYNWLVWIAFRLFGVGIPSLALVKYAVLAAAYTFVYLAARRILPSSVLAALASFSLVMMVPLGWVVHEALTHSVAALAAAAATFYALVRLEESGSRLAYVAFGAALGLGLLAKFSYSLFGGALLVAALTVDRYRARLLRPRLALSLAVTAVLIAPYFLWFYRQEFSLAGIYAEEVDPGQPEPYLRGLLLAVYYAVRVTLYYVTPLWLVYLWLFRSAWTWREHATDPAAPARRLLGRFFLAEFGLLGAAALVGGLTYLKFRWLLPAFFLFPLFVFSHLDPRQLPARGLRRFAWLLLAAEALVALAFVVSILRGDRWGKPSPLNASYDVVAARLAAAGFTGGTIAAGDGPLGGNLRLRFPGSRVIRLTNPDYVPPGGGGGQCLIAWERGPGDTVPPEMRDWLAAALDVRLGGEEPVRTLEVLYHHARRHTLRVRYVLLDGGAGRCG